MQHFLVIFTLFLSLSLQAQTLDVAIKVNHMVDLESREIAKSKLDGPQYTIVIKNNVLLVIKNKVLIESYKVDFKKHRGTELISSDKDRKIYYNTQWVSILDKNQYKTYWFKDNNLK